MKDNQEFTMIEDNTDKEKYAEQAAELLNKNPEVLKPDQRLGKRHLQIINICFLVFVAYFVRNSLAVAIVAMNDRNSTRNSDIPTFHWSNKNVIQASFFMGYFPSQIFMGYCFIRYGIKWLSVTLFACCCIFGLSTPYMVYWFEDTGIIVMRLLQGVTQSFVFPASQQLIAQWVPPDERGRLGGAVFSARPLATVTSMFCSGYIAASWYGWPWVFYISNGVGLLWCVSFALFSYDNPQSHPSISTKERIYIDRSLGQTIINKKRKIPWRAIATSIPFWACLLTHIGFSWTAWTQQSQIPMYMKYVMKFDITTSGTLSALPYLMQWILSHFFCFLSDHLIQKKVWSIGTARKTMNSIGMFTPAICFIILQNTDKEESTIAVILLVVGLAVNGACVCGVVINEVDLSPRFASVLMGILNGPAQTTGFLAPLFVQAVVKNETDQEEWKYVFYTAAGVYIVSGLIFIIFGSVEVQPWNSEKKIEAKELKK